MKSKATIVKLFAAFLFGITAVSFGLWGLDASVTQSDARSHQFSGFSRQSPAAPTEMLRLSEANRPTSELMARLFQLMFILFFISPPIIALLLFLIWKELKKRNELK